MIRLARDEDFPAITAITNHYIATTTIHFAYEPLAPDYLHGLWRQSTRHPWFVACKPAERTSASERAEAHDGVVGYAKAGTWRDRAAYDWTAEVGLYVAHDARGRGIGRALYAALLAELAQRGFRSAIAGITLPNDASLALHRAFGFDSVGIVRDAGYKLGQWCDVEFFQKRFAT